MDAKEIKELQDYLRKYLQVHVLIDGEKRKLFFNSQLDAYGIVRRYMRKKGDYFYDWDRIEKVFYPKAETEIDRASENMRIIARYKKLAAKATFKSHFIDSIMNADEKKSVYENGLSTGVPIENKTISLKSICEYAPFGTKESYLEALKEGKDFRSGRFYFRGYDGTLWCSVEKDGTVTAGFNKEYRNCGNGYYYMAINDDTFVGYDID